MFGDSVYFKEIMFLWGRKYCNFK